MYAALGRLVDELSVLTFSERERNRSWAAPDVAGYRRVALPGRHIFVRRRDWALHFNFGIRAALRALAPEAVVIGGYDSPGHWVALSTARRMGVPVVLWNGSHAASSRSTSRIINALKRAFVRRCDAFFTYGALAADYVEALGARGDRIVCGVNAVECERFAAPAGDRDAFRGDKGAAERIVVLYSGQLIERKGVDDLIRAMTTVPVRAVLWVVGDGRLRARYEALARELLPERCVFFGDKPYAELPRIYQAADLLVMPSLVEVWGLVVNEALASGLPVIASSAAGATADLIDGKGTGLAVTPGNAAALSSAISKLVTDDLARAAMGIRAKQLMTTLNTAKYAADMYRAVQLALGAR